MIPFAVKEKDITADYRDILRLADELFRAAVDGTTCHELCATWLEVSPGTGRVVKGLWNGMYGHAWIELEGGAILDVYPVGGVRPTLFTKKIFEFSDSVHVMYLEKV